MYLVPLALVAGIAVQHEWPGDFEYGLRHGGPGIVTWWALVGGAVALALGLALEAAAPIRERHLLGAAAALLFVLPIAVHGFRHWTPRVPSDPQALSPELVRQLRELPPRAVVIAPLETSYRILALAPGVRRRRADHARRRHEGEPPVRPREGRRALARDRRPGDPAQLRRHVGRRKGVLYPARQG